MNAKATVSYGNGLRRENLQVMVCNDASGCPVAVHHRQTQPAILNPSDATQFDPVLRPSQQAVPVSAMPQHLGWDSYGVSPDTSPASKQGVGSLQTALNVSALQSLVFQSGLSDNKFESSNDVGTALVYQIFSDDEADGPIEDSDLDPCWTRSWARLREPTSDPLSSHSLCDAMEQPRFLYASPVSSLGPRRPTDLNKLLGRFRLRFLALVLFQKGLLS